METQFSRTEMIIGSEGLEKLQQARVAVFGIGGVGGHAMDALVRSGIGAIDIIDNDTVSLTNLNRQLIATQKTIGMAKTEAAYNHILEINPNCKVKQWQTFYTPETAHLFDFHEYDYVIDAIDTVSGKIQLVKQAYAAETKIICSMGAGNKLDPTRFEVADIYQTSVCPLARVMRHELRKAGIPNLKVVYSKEEPVTPSSTTEQTYKKTVPGSMSFVPSVAGLILAGEVIKDILAEKKL